MNRGKIKGRSVVTYQRKLHKLEKIYKKLFKVSKRAKDKKKVRSVYFCDKFPNFDKYKEIIKLKEVSR